MSIFTSAATATAETPYEFTVKDIDGKPIDLSKYKGKVVLVVNVASQCGKYFLLSQDLQSSFQFVPAL